MNTLSKLLILFLPLYFFVFVSCERDNLVEGPLLEELYGDFMILTPLESNTPEIDFSAGEDAYFTARFSLQAQWELKIIGKESGAVKVFTGISKELNISNTLWNGSTTIFPMFTTEECDVELRNDKDTNVLYTSIKVLGLKDNPGTLVADFEKGIQSGWVIFKQSGANMTFTVSDDTIAPQGQFYFDMGGEVTWDWLIGMIDFPASSYGNDGFGLNKNPENEYFNVIMFLPKGITNALVLFQFREDENGDGQFNESSEDMWSLELKTLEEGWQLISIKYSDLQALQNGQPTTPNGNGLHEPDKLWRLSTLMLADPSSGYSQTYMDYIIFTQGGPLEP